VLEALLDRFRRGDRLALARLLSLVARGEHIPDILARLPPDNRRARVVAVTGSSGVGKSTLVGKLIEALRRQGKTVAVLACDPQSPLTGGALLGDRFRMPSRPEDDGVFIRSVSAPGGHGAVARHAGAMVRLLDGFGFDVILIETVGAGQGDTAVSDLAGVVVLLLQPETGDDLQWEKAGVLEVADVVAVHKADLPGADRALGQVRAALDLSGGPGVPVLRVSSKTGEGVEALARAVLDHTPRPRAHPAALDDLLRLAQETLAERLAAARAGEDPDLRQLLDRWQGRRVSHDEAAAALLRLLSEGGGSGR
jgi:LAO/AO transport system ATPase